MIEVSKGGAMDLVLTDEEGHLVREVLRHYLSDLRGEIADTDNPAFKRGLRHEREVLDSIAARLDAGPDFDPPIITSVIRVVEVRMNG
jgi:hypothetical protein